MKMLPNHQLQLYHEILCFLEKVYSKRGPYEKGASFKESKMDILILNFTKVVNDCRAILLLSQNDYYIQAGIITRSTSDSCNLMMHIGFEGEEADIVDRWIAGEQITHWALVDRLNKYLGGGLDIDAHRESRYRLNDFVHANFQALTLYPAQSPGPTPLDEHSFSNMIFWKNLLYLFLISCLLVTTLIVPSFEKKAKKYLQQLIEHYDPK